MYVKSSTAHAGFITTVHKEHSKQHMQLPAIQILLYHIPVSLYAFLYGLQALAMATATGCFVFNIIITDYVYYTYL